MISPDAPYRIAQGNRAKIPGPRSSVAQRDGSLELLSRPDDGAAAARCHAQPHGPLHDFLHPAHLDGKALCRPLSWPMAKQWLEIAMLMACDPDLILLDEPTAGMTIAGHSGRPTCL
jgi:hypothetical protein